MAGALEAVLPYALGVLATVPVLFAAGCAFRQDERLYVAWATVEYARH